MNTFARNLTGAKWSKEYVEHLRTIHFALVTVAVALVVLVLSAKKYDPIRALAEAEEILELKSPWSPEWIRQNGASEVQYFPGCDNFSNGCLKKYAPIEVPPHDLIRSVVLQADLPDFAFHNGTLIDFELPADNWSFDFRPESIHWSPNSFPKNIVEFRSWWNDLGQRAYGISFPTAVSALNGSVIRLDDTTVGELREVPEDEENKNPVRIRIPEVFVDFLDEKEVSRFGLNEKALYYVAIGKQSYAYEIPVITALHSTITQDTIANKFQNLRRGDFDASFADLASAGSTYKTLDLTRAESIMREDASKGNDVFEALGMKFPAVQITL